MPQCLLTANTQYVPSPLHPHSSGVIVIPNWGSNSTREHNSQASHPHLPLSEPARVPAPPPQPGQVLVLVVRAQTLKSLWTPGSPSLLCPEIPRTLCVQSLSSASTAASAAQPAGARLPAGASVRWAAPLSATHGVAWTTELSSHSWGGWRSEVRVAAAWAGPLGGPYGEGGTGTAPNAPSC